MIYYKINQNPEEYKAIYGVEYIDSIPHFLGYLNKNKIRKQFFSENEVFNQFNGDETAIKDYIKENMILKVVYYMGSFVDILYDKDIAHIFSKVPFLNDQEIIDRNFKMSLIRKKYSHLLNEIFTECLQERQDFYKLLNEAKIFITTNKLKKIEEATEEEKEKYKFYHEIYFSYLSRNKRNDHTLKFFPKLKKVIESEDFKKMQQDLKDNRASIYDLMYSKNHGGLAQFINNF